MPRAAERLATFTGHTGRGEAAVLYARTSKDSDDAFSVADQIDKGGEYIARYDFNCPQEYIFAETHTGTVMRRPELDKVRQLVRSGRVKHIIIYRTDRLARKTDVAEQLLDEFTHYGITLHIVQWGQAVRAEDENARLMFQVESVFGDREARMIRNRTKDGRDKKQAAGVWNGAGRARYGYELTGRKLDTRMVFHNAEIAIVRSIFEEFDRGVRARVLLEALNHKKVPTPNTRGGIGRLVQPNWTINMIYSILRDPCYTGRFHVGKTKTIKTETGARQRVRTAREEWDVMHFPELQAIPDDLFDRVQQRLDSGRAMLAPPTKNQYLMARRLTCWKCGLAMRSKNIAGGSPGKRERGKYSYYQCESRGGVHWQRSTGGDFCFGKHTGKKSIRSDHVDETVWSWAVEFLNNPTAAFHAYKRIQESQQAAHPDTLEHIEAARAFVAKYERDLAAWAQMRVDGDITPAIFKEKKAELDARLRAAQDVLQEYESAAAQQMLSDREIRGKIDALTALGEELARVDVITFEHRKRVIELLDVRGILGEDEHGVYIIIVWHGQHMEPVLAVNPNGGGDLSEESDRIRGIKDYPITTIPHSGAQHPPLAWRVYIGAPVVLDALIDPAQHVHRAHF